MRPRVPPLTGFALVVLLAAALFAPFVALPAAGFGERRFESNPIAGSGDPSYHVYAGSTLAQSFHVNTSFLIEHVTLRVRNAGGAMNALVVSIHPDDAVRHVPVMSVRLATSSQVTPDNASGPTNYTFPFNPSALLSAGATYWIVAENGAAQGPPLNGYEWVESNADSYPGGSAYVLDPGTGVWTGLPYDLYFITYGREYAADVSVAVTTNRSQAQPGDSVTLTVYFNNSGNGTARTVWINETLDSALVSPSLAFPTLQPVSAASFPNLTFLNVTNGAYRFTVTVRVAIGTAPGSVLGDAVSLRYANATGALFSGGTAHVSILIGLATKQLYLGGTPIATKLLTTRRPSSSTLTTTSLSPGSSALDFQLAPVLARPFGSQNLTAGLWISIQKTPPQTLRLNLSLLDGSTVLGWVRPTLSVTKSGYQLYNITFPAQTYSFAAGHIIRFQLWNLGGGSGSTDTLVLSYNSTSNPSHLDLVTTTYVSVGTLVLRNGPRTATRWSPLDPLIVEANVSDPFGSSRIAGAWVNITNPSGQIVLAGPMAVAATDPSAVPAWIRYNDTINPPLSLGTYTIDVLAMEDNGVVTRAQGFAAVVQPSLSLADMANVTRARAAQSFAYFLYFNNTGTSSARNAWLNATLPSQVAFVTSSLVYANVTGSTYSWTFTNLSAGPHALEIDVRVLGNATTAAWIASPSTLDLTDVSGHPMPQLAARADVFLNGPIVAVSGTSIPSGTIHSNETVTYTISLRNTGDAAQNLWLNDTMPATFAYVSDSASTLGGTTTVSGASIRFRFQAMPGGATWSFQLTLRSGSVLTRGALYPDVLDLNYTSTTGYLMPSERHLVPLTSIAPWIDPGAVSFVVGQASPRQTVAAVLLLMNNGSEVAPFAWANLTLDARLSVVNASRPMSGAGTAIGFALVALPLGATRIYLNVTVNDTVANGAVLQILGIVEYRDAVGNPLPAVILAPASLTVTAAILSLAVSPVNLTVEAGLTVPFSVTVTNSGGIASGNVWLNLSMPTSFSYYADTSRTTLNIIGSTYSWQWTGQLPGLFGFNLFVKPRESTPNGTVAPFVFFLAYHDVDGRPRPTAQNTVEATVISPRLVLSLIPDRTEVVSGGALAYTIQVRNDGMTMAQQVSLSDDVDPRLHVETYNATVTATGVQRLTWNFTDLLPGVTQTVTLTVVVAQGLGTGTLIPMALEVNYTNSAGMILGHLRSAPVVVTVGQDLSVVMWGGLAALAIAGSAVIVRSLRTKVDIEDVFLVYRDGVLISHLSRTIMREKDEDVLSGMLTAVQEFVREAFQYGEHRDLHQLDFGEYRILIERGKYVYLAVVYAGDESPQIRKKVRAVIDRIEEKFGKALETWDGDMDQVVGARDLLASLLGTGNLNHTTKPGAED